MLYIILEHPIATCFILFFFFEGLEGVVRQFRTDSGIKQKFQMNEDND